MSGRFYARAVLFVIASCFAAATVAAQTPSPPPQTPQPAQSGAAPDAQAIRDEVAKLRGEFEQVRQQYDARLAALEGRLVALEGAATPSPAAPPPQNAAAMPPAQTPATPPAEAPAPQTTAAPPQVQVPAGAASGGGPEGTLPVYGNVSALSKIFNPDIAAIGNFLGAVGKNDIEPAPGLALDEAEASFQAVVDPYAKADFFVSVGPEGAELEEGYLTLTSLPAGLLMKVGKMRSAFGKVNQMHSHVLPWTDRPLVTRNLVGGEEGVADSGISVSKLILNPWFFLEATGEVYGGESEIFRAPTRSDLTYVGHLRGYHDISENMNLDLGASIAYGHNDASDDSTTRLFGVDATFRYRPLRRAIYRRFLGRTELVWSRREQPAPDFTAKSFGYYASGEYQFARRWFSGLRWDWSERATNADEHDRGPSVLLTFWPSEFSQMRGQYRRTRYAEGVTANEFLFQFLFAIGAHGAHTF
jgi:hypothetical protein